MRNNDRDNPDSPQDNQGVAILRWLFSMPPVARPLIAAFAIGWWLCFLAGALVENYELPGQEWWLIVWNGSLGGNSFSAFGALLLKFLLTSEVTIMIFTLAGNRRRVQDAAAKAREEGVEIGREEGVAIGREKGREEGVAIGREEGRQEGRQEGVVIGRQEERQEILQQVAEWYESAKAEIAAGHEPDPPSILGENGNKPD